MSQTTIFARSTGALPSAIAIVRASGPQAASALRALSGQTLPEPRSAIVRTLRFPETATIIDRALVLWLPGPTTVTGEDMVEFHVHGGRAVVAAVEAALASLPGLLPAAPGEFTRRAFENGRLDLSQVEGLADLLNAETERQRAAALAMSEGGLRRQVMLWQGELIALAARAEALIDFDGEGDVAIDPTLRADIRCLAGELDAVTTRPPVERLRDGVRVALAGPPNAGKSTLLNALVDRAAAITSPIAGTTRDLIEIPVVLDGIPIVLIDMAGVREGWADEIERLGVERAHDAIARCDLILWLGEIADAPAGRVIMVGTKYDLCGEAEGAAVSVSAVTGHGLPALRQMLAQRASDLLPAAGSVALSRWQRSAVTDAAQYLAAAVGSTDLVFCAEELRYAMRMLDRITGEGDVETMLDALFARFCIGK